MGLKPRPTSLAATVSAAIARLRGFPDEAAMVSLLNRRNLYTVDEIRALDDLEQPGGDRPARSEAIEAARARFAEPLPPSLVELWQIESTHRGFARGFLMRKLVTPEQLISPPRWAADARLSAQCPRVSGGGYSDTREIFANEYQEWFDATEPALRLAKVGDLTGREPGALFRIDPALAGGHIPIAGYHSETHFVTAALRLAGGESPVFSHHDDDEGLCELEGRSCGEWLEREIARSMAKVSHRDPRFSPATG